MILDELIRYLHPDIDLPDSENEKRQLFRALRNIRPPQAESDWFIAHQNAVLQAELAEKGVVTLADLQPICPNIYLWQGDITRLKVGAIVNACNDALLGCFHPLHRCIDNAIHSQAGVQLRLACFELMTKQGHPEPTGKAKITPAFNLPSDYVLHTVGPIIYGDVSKRDCQLLADCYRSCLALADKQGIDTVAFCCISTGEFRFPNPLAGKIAVQTVRDFLETHPNMNVVFNVFKDKDWAIYAKLLGE